jgi:hypothetical protein
MGRPKTLGFVSPDGFTEKFIQMKNELQNLRV